MSGYHNRLLEIDLTQKKTDVVGIDPNYVRDFIGGSSLAARLFLDTSGVDLDALNSDSPLFVMTGPIVGTNFPGSSRFVICARSPLTGIWGESASGGGFGTDLKRAGYDGMVIYGKAEKPSYILIEDDKVSIIDAGDIWGRDTYDTIDTLGDRHGGKPQLRVMAIGPAGENLVRFACISNDKAHYFGRAGMGAVMGSKNLKAMAVRGSGKVPIFDEDAYKEVRKASLGTIRESMIANSFSDLGTAAAMEMGMVTGDVPIKNWSLGEAFEMGMAIGGSTMVDTILTKRSACYTCPVACKPVVKVDDPKYFVPEGPGPEYETCGTFGTMIMNDNLYALAKANDVVNRLGLDSISCGATIAFIIEAYENGIIGKVDTDGLEMTWGNIDAVIEMTEKIAKRDGFGDLAADGSLELAKKIGKGAMDFVVEVKGLELPMHDPRAFHGMGLAYMNSNRGACHLQHSDQAVEQGMVSWNEVGLLDDYPGPDSTGKAEVVYITENIGQMANAVCICHFVHWCMGLANLLDGFNAVTGRGFDLEDFMVAGRRAWVIKRGLNNLMGVTSADDRLPKRVLTPLSEGGIMGSVPDVELMKKEYYKIRGLGENGFPTHEALDSLDLGFLKERLYR